jgi:hypothetical protein
MIKQNWMRLGLRSRLMACVVLALVAAVSVASSSSKRKTANNNTQSGVKSPATAGARTRFEISFTSVIHAEPITGRVFVAISRTEKPEPRKRVGFWGDAPPLFGQDVNVLPAGQPAVIDGSTPGYPLASLQDIAPGDYYVQAVMNIYTQFHRADGHAIWAHMDQWEGQQFNQSPGNLYSEVEKVHLDPKAGYDVKLSLTKTIPAIQMPADTAWVKHIKIESPLLSRFWGHPMYLGATVLLPKGYDTHPNVYYPVVYVQGHFGLRPPFGFNTHEPTAEQKKYAERLRAYGLEPGYDFYQAWASNNFPRMIAVTFQHPTPFFDDSYAVNSANNGPYGDALLRELIPYLEKHFRMISQPYARVLTGGSTGGWESLALQVFHPDFFNGTWTFYPDPVDFRRYGIINVYEDGNAFVPPGHHWLFPERPLERSPDGQVQTTVRQFSQLEDVLGTHGRSAQQLEAWEAVYGPVDDNGYPKPLWDKRTGKIDHQVALYMRDHGYDLRYTLSQNWAKIGSQLKGKIHVYVGDMDSYYLNLAVYDLQNFMQSTENPHDAGYFEYGRPMKPHGWTPMTQSELVKAMARHVERTAPAGQNTSVWNYN